MFLRISLSSLILVSLSQNAMEDSPKTMSMKHEINEITLMDIPQFKKTLKSKFPNRMDPNFHAFSVVQTLENNPTSVAFEKLEYLIMQCKVSVDATDPKTKKITPLSLYFSKALTDSDYLVNVKILLKLGANPLFSPGKNPSPFSMANEFRCDDHLKYPYAAELTKLLVKSLKDNDRAHAKKIIKETNHHIKAILDTFAQTNEFIKEAQENKNIEVARI